MAETVNALSPVERLQLANQYRILEKLDPEDAEAYAGYRYVLERGYTAEYGPIFKYIWEETSIEECRFVHEVLDLYRTLIQSFEALKDKQGLTPEDVRFGGFDGNNESKLWGYVSYLQKQGQWPEPLTGGTDSHGRVTSSYHSRLLRNFEPIKEEILASHSGRWLVTADQIKKVIGKE